MELFESSEARKHVENVLDRDTMEALYTLSDEGQFDLLYGFVKDGKESKVAVAEQGDRKLAAKLYVTDASNYEDMKQYLIGDPRFDGITQDRRSVVYHWATKEYRNLELARSLDIPAPEPVAVEKNVLLMEFVGQEFSPAPKLEEVDLENPRTALDRIVDRIATLWNDADLVHADLSPFNILLWNQRLWLIDFSQAVLRAHPRAEAFLERDVNTVADHVERQYDLAVDRGDIMERITGREDS